MKNPRRATELILRKKPKDYPSREREQDWDAEAVVGFRDELRARADSLADQWRAERAAREEQRRKESTAATAGPGPGPGAAGAPSEAVEDSDDEINVGEVISKAKPASTKGKGKGKAAAAAAATAPPEQTKADRLR